METRRILLLVTLVLVGPGSWHSQVWAAYDDAYMNQFTTLGNSTVYDDALPSDEGRVAFAWSGHTGPSHHEAPGTPDNQELYDDGYQPEKAHPEFIWDNCMQVDTGEVILNGTRSCHLIVTGFDVHADLLTGGLDGLYLLVGCYIGKALYIRKDSPMGEERSLWFSLTYGDWQFMLGPHPAESELVVYSNYGQLSPLDADGWHLSADYSSIQSQYLTGHDELFFKVKGVTVTCEKDAPTQPGQHITGVEDEWDKCDPRDPMCVVAPPSAPPRQSAPASKGAGASGGAAAPAMARGWQRRNQRA